MRRFQKARAFVCSCGFLVLLFVLSLISADVLGVGRHAIADDRIGTIKKVEGAVRVVRAKTSVIAKEGGALAQGDVIETGSDGSVGIRFQDDSRMALGPNSALELTKFVYDAEAKTGSFDSRLSNGTMSGSSGRITSWKPGAMKVTTPSMLIAVRGTKFVIRAEGP